MKYGIVYYKDTDNIGDDIQNYAVMQFLPHVDYLIDREQLNNFQSEEIVAVILNGWFLHNKFNWPPAKSIYPLCLSMHFTQNDYMDIGYKYLDGVGGEYLKNYEPIGSRDQSTYDVLKGKGIETYLSGCATLTLKQRRKKQDSDYVCVVDISDDAEVLIQHKLENTNFYIRKVTHCVDYANEKISWDERISRVEKILDIYQNAKCVVTKRLHCALPCLALGTPVLLLLDEKTDDVTRYSHFTDLLHVTSTENFIRNKCEFDLLCPPLNKDLYLQDRDKTIQKIEKFINNTESNQVEESFHFWKAKDEKEILEWRMQLLTHAAKSAANKVDILLRENGKIKQDAFNDLSILSKQYTVDTEKLEKSLQEKLIEEKRLYNVISAKTSEENRLNEVINLKEAEEKRLNSVITMKNIEEVRLNKLIPQLNSQICQRENELNILQSKLKELKNTICYLNESSIVWLLFFSQKYKNATLKDKVTMLISATKNPKKETNFDEILKDND